MIDCPTDLACGLDRSHAFRGDQLTTDRFVPTPPQIRTAIIGAALIAAAVSLDDFIIASFTIGGGNTLSTFVWGKMRTTLDPSINAIATILPLSTIGMSLLAMRLARYRGCLKEAIDRHGIRLRHHNPHDGRTV